MSGWDMRCVHIKEGDLCKVLVWLHPTRREEMIPELVDRGVGVCVLSDTLYGHTAGANQTSSNVTTMT